MSDEPSVKDKFGALEGVQFYAIIRVKGEVRRKGEDPKYTDKTEFSEERGFVAGDLTELETRATQVLGEILENLKQITEPEEPKKPGDAPE